MSDKLGKDVIDYIISCLEIAESLEVESDSYKHNSPFPEIGIIKVHKSLDAYPTVEFSPDGWENVFNNYFLEFSNYISAAIIKKRYLGDLRTLRSFKEGKISFSLDFKNSQDSFYALHINQSGVVICSEYGANILQDAWNGIKRHID